jgi:GNAT superfamily N-acetyltransferase
MPTRRRNAPRRNPESLAQAEAHAARLEREVRDYERAVLRKYGPAAHGYTLDEQLVEPTMFYRARLNELMREHGVEWVIERFRDAPAAKAHAAREDERLALLSRLRDLRTAAGLDPFTGQPKAGTRNAVEGVSEVEAEEALLPTAQFRSNCPSPDILSDDGTIEHAVCRWKRPRDAWHHLRYFVDGRAVSALTLRQTTFPTRGRAKATIDLVYTDPEYRGKGYAAALLREARDYFSEVKHSNDLTAAGAAWKARVGNPRRRITHNPRRPAQGVPMKTSSGNTRPTRTAQVNAYLASHGFPDVTLHKGAGYFYFSGPDVDDWRGTSVMVPYLGDLTLAAWLEEAHMLAGSARKNPARRRRNPARKAKPLPPTAYRDLVSLAPQLQDRIYAHFDPLGHMDGANDMLASLLRTAGYRVLGVGGVRVVVDVGDGFAAKVAVDAYGVQQNRNEATFWKASPLPDIMPVHDISQDGTVLLTERAETPVSEREASFAAARLAKHPQGRLIGETEYAFQWGRHAGAVKLLDYGDTRTPNPRRRKNGALAPLVVGGLALAAGAVAYHSQRTPGAAPAAGWKKERLPAGFGKGYRYTRTIDGMKYEIDDEKATYRISLRVGERLERIHPPGTDWGSWPSVAEAQRAAEDDARFHVRKNPRRRKNGLLGAVGLLGLGFAGGAYLESEKPFVRRLRERSRGPAKAAREQAERLQREVFTPAPAKRVPVPAPSPVKRTATTDPAWRRERNQQGKGYSHLRTINGVDYEVWERIYNDGGKAIFLEAGDKRDRILAPNGEEDGWKSVAVAKKAAEADAKTRKNPRRRK